MLSMSYYRTRKPRRSRYTVTFSDGDKGVILAYAGQSDEIVKHYARMGKTVVSVVKGDHVNGPRAANGGGWSIIPANYREALDFFGLTMPVKVKQTAHQGGRYGAHSFRVGPDGRPYHHITVKSWLDPQQAGRTLWHELTHAMQAEREAAGTRTTADALRAWRTTSARMGSYRDRPIEVEARAHEDYNDVTPLAR